MTANRFRMIGAFLALSSYILLVNGYDIPGISLNIGAQGALAPFNIQNKCWDMLGMGAFFTVVNIQALLT